MGFFQQLGNGISNLVNGVGSAIGSVFETVGQVGQQLIDGVSKLGQQVVDGVTTLITGIFGGDQETTKVSTFVSRIIQDDLVPNSIRNGIIKGTISNKDPVPYITQNLISGLALKAEKAYRYGKESYTFGVPTQKMFSNMTSERILKAFIENYFQEDAIFDYCFFGRPNYLHVHGWINAVNTYAYDSVDNQLGYFSNSKGTPVYLKDIVVTVTKDTFDAPFNNVLNQQGVSPNAGATPVRFASDSRGHTPIQIGESHFVTIYYVWEGLIDKTIDGITIKVKSILEDSVVIKFNPDESGGVYQLSYKTKTNINKRWYSKYVAGSGWLPELDAAYNASYDGLGSFFPMIHFRNNKAPVHSNTTSKEYKSSEKMLKYWGLEYEDIANSIAANKDVGNVEQAFIMMGVPAVTKNKVEQEYLFDFFSLMYLAKVAELGEDSYLDVSKEYSGTLGSKKQLTKIPSLGILIQDQLFKMGLNCSEIKRVIKSGSIGQIGTLASALEHEEIINQTSDGSTTTTHIAKHIYKRQLTETAYTEITVYGLSLTYYIHGAFNTVGIGDAPSLLIPLDYSITSKYSAKNKEILYARSLHMVINCREVQVVKWYQKLLGDVLLVAAVVMLIYSAGQAVQGAMALAAQGASLATIAIYLSNIVVTYLLDSYILQESTKYVAEKLGAENALIVAVIAALYVGRKLYEIGGDFSKLPALTKILTSASVSTMNASAKLYADAIKDISAEANRFATEAEKKEKELKEVEKLLEHDHTISSILVWGESPSDFYNRTVHSGNIGMVGIDMVSSYVSIALSLPKISETLDT